VHSAPTYDLAIYGLIGYGSYSIDNEDDSLTEVAAGCNFFLKKDGTTSGVIGDYGYYKTLGEKKEFYGLLINAFEQGDKSWLKWYIGRFDDENLITTDVCFEIHEDVQYHYALQIRGFIVNSHSDSIAAPPVMSYGSVISDWTEHQEYWLHVKIVMNKPQQANWKLLLGYGFYRADHIDGSNNSAMMKARFTFYF
jgi:hypothetical protein